MKSHGSLWWAVKLLEFSDKQFFAELQAQPFCKLLILQASNLATVLYYNDCKFSPIPAFKWM